MFKTKKLVSLIGAAWNKGQIKKGVEKGPSDLRNFSLIENIKALNLKVQDLGDIDTSSIQKKNVKSKKFEILGQLNYELYKKIHSESKKDNFTLLLGGDHSSATGSVYGNLSTHKDNLKILWIDAHADIHTPKTSPSQNYHGMPMGHLLGLDNTNKIPGFEWKKKNIDPSNLVFLGIRDLQKEEKEIIKELNIKYYSPFDIEEKGGIKNVMDEINLYLDLKNKDSKLHVSFDIDGACSSYIKGTGTPYGYGLGQREVGFMMNYLSRLESFIHMDLVEVNSDLELKILKDVYGCEKIARGYMETLRYTNDFILFALGKEFV